MSPMGKLRVSPSLMTTEVISFHASRLPLVLASKTPTARMVPKLPPAAVNSTAEVLAIAPPDAAPKVMASRA